MRRLHAKDRMAAVARRAVQREAQARAADRRRDGGVMTFCGLPEAG